jgi:dihydroorotate dehydrogenase (fumarate)
MERTSIRLGGVELGSSVMNASGARSAERGEIYELCAVHGGAIVFKSCNRAGLELPENLKNRGVAYFGEIAHELIQRGKKIVGSVVGVSEEEFVDVARMLDRAGVSIVELNLADDYVTKSVAPFASFERLKSLLGRVRGETQCVLAVKVPSRVPFEPRAVADLFKSMRIAIAVCANDLPKDLSIDVASGAVEAAARTLSQAHAFFKESENLLDVVAVGGINSGRDAYIAHLTGAKAVQVGSALMKEGAGALGRIDRELDSILAEHGHKFVSEVVGKIRFSG